MNTSSRWPALAWVLGLALLAVTLVSANRLIQPDNMESTGQQPAPRPSSTHPATTVLGIVDSDPSPIKMGPPATAALATVEKVLVNEGQEVRPGDPLVQFDSTLLKGRLAEARAGLAEAEIEVERAGVQERAHKIDLERQQASIANAEANIRDATDALAIARDQFERALAFERNPSTTAPLTEAEKEERRRNNLELRAAEARIRGLRALAADEKLKLQLLELKPIALDMKKAQAAVERFKSLVQQAEAAVNDSVVRARVHGVVERIEAGPGMTYGPGTRESVLMLVPSGMRIVRAEVEAEFAHRVSDRTGSRVVITDAHNTSLTYEGVVRRVGGTYVVKRSAADTLTLNPPKAIECLIDVTDSAPAGKPVLRVGQPVRVTFP